MTDYPASCEVHDWIEIYDDEDGFIVVCTVCGEDQ